MNRARLICQPGFKRLRSGQAYVELSRPNSALVLFPGLRGLALTCRVMHDEIQAFLRYRASPSVLEVNMTVPENSRGQNAELFCRNIFQKVAFLQKVAPKVRTLVIEPGPLPKAGAEKEDSYDVSRDPYYSNAKDPVFLFDSSNFPALKQVIITQDFIMGGRKTIEEHISRNQAELVKLITRTVQLRLAKLLLRHEQWRILKQRINTEGITVAIKVRVWRATRVRAASCVPSCELTMCASTIFRLTKQGLSVTHPDYVPWKPLPKAKPGSPQPVFKIVDKNQRIVRKSMVTSSDDFLTGPNRAST